MPNRSLIFAIGYLPEEGRISEVRQISATRSGFEGGIEIGDLTIQFSKRFEGDPDQFKPDYSTVRIPIVSIGESFDMRGKGREELFKELRKVVDRLEEAVIEGEKIERM